MHDINIIYKNVFDHVTNVLKKLEHRKNIVFDNTL